MTATTRASDTALPKTPPPTPDLARDLVGLSALLTQAQITVRKLLVRADADEARKMLEVRS
jgi:hypothetical protein